MRCITSALLVSFFVWWCIWDMRKIDIAMFWFTEYVDININPGEHRYRCILHDNTSLSLNMFFFCFVLFSFCLSVRVAGCCHFPLSGVFFFVFKCNCDEGNSPTFWHDDVISLHTAAISIAKRESNIGPRWKTYFQKGDWLQWCRTGFLRNWSIITVQHHISL